MLFTHVFVPTYFPCVYAHVFVPTYFPCVCAHPLYCPRVSHVFPMYCPRVFPTYCPRVFSHAFYVHFFPRITHVFFSQVFLPRAHVTHVFHPTYDLFSHVTHVFLMTTFLPIIPMYFFLTENIFNLNLKVLQTSITQTIYIWCVEQVHAKYEGN